MRNFIFLISILLILSMFACDAPSPFSYKGQFRKENKGVDLWANVVGGIVAVATPEYVDDIEDRVVIKATVLSLLGFEITGVDVTFTTDTGFFRSEELGPSQVFTVKTDSYGNSYAHLIYIGRTCTVKIQAGEITTYVIIEFRN